MEEEIKETELEENMELENKEEEIETEVQRAKKKRREAIFEMSLFFILGLLIGITLKTEAVKKITIGFNDYQIKKSAQSYDVDAIKKDLDAKAAEQQAAGQSADQGQQPASIQQ